MIQWHPIFARLLRPAVEAYYDVQTNLAVGDVPREADFVLLRRLAATPPPPFRGLWRNLTTWNVFEYKGPTVTPRRGHIEKLVEVGLGIDRRMRTRRGAARQRRLEPQEVSFWYLANHLGRRFLREAQRLLPEVEALSPGLWRSEVLGRLVFLVSSIDLPVEEDSLPLHIVGQEPLATERQVAQFVAAQRELQTLYGGWMASLHPQAWKEIEPMLRKTRKGWDIDIDAAVDALGPERIIKSLGVKRVVELIGAKRLVEEVGAKHLLEEVGFDRFLASLSPAERRELKRRLS